MREMGRGGEVFICDRERNRERERIGVGMVWYGMVTGDTEEAVWLTI